MLIYIIHPDKIYDYRLPKTVDGKFILTDYDKYGNKRNLINIEARNDNWCMLGNDNVKLTYNGKIIDSINLKINNFYTLTIQETEVIFIYTMPSYDSSFTMKELLEDNTYIVGSKENNDIVFKCGINSDLLKINYSKGQYSYETLNNQIPVYVNKELVQSGYLNNYDTIFIMGLKIVIFNNRIIINNPGNTPIRFNNTKFKPFTDTLITGNINTDVRTFTNFYDEKDYYFKTPVFKQQITPLDLTISDPPQPQEKNKDSILMTIIPTFIMSLMSIVTAYYTISRYRKGEANFEELVTALIMAIGFGFTGVFWPAIERKYTNYLVKYNNKRNSQKYNKYLEEKNKQLEEEVREQKMVLVTSNLSYKDCERVIKNRNPELFSRDIDSLDFLNIRLGIGNIKLKVNLSYDKPDFILDSNELYGNVDKIIEQNKYIPEAPFILPLKEHNVITFILENKRLFNEYMNGIILQLITLHSYNDLKLVVLTSSENSEISYLRDSNFCWNEDRSFRYYATNLEEAQKISTFLEKEFKQRKNTDNAKYKPYYLIISNSIDLYRNLNIVNDVIENSENLGFGILMYDTKINNIPKGCVNFVNITRNDGTVFNTNMSNDEIQNFKPEFIVSDNVSVDRCSRMISNIPIKEPEADKLGLPNSFGFLQMFGVGNVEQLNILNRWNNSNPYNSLSVPIGVDNTGNLIYLDLHEKSHGPHGLIAGMTGSGKSELIVTYILSMALNFRPDEVQFILIDYKGGGLAGAFENRKLGIKLPHLVGTITNLDKAEMKRTLVSINSELKRRQRLFNKAKETLNTGNIDIYKYQKLHRDGVIKEHLSHLFIICDEFAELRAQEPEFMEELVSAARIGRSLGIHLILATQKPTGVVDDQIWSNAKFKICCKVQTEGDSNEMLKKPDAAYLTQAGSFYLQVGYDEYFVQGQSAYSGFPYIPTDRIATKIDNDIAFVDNTGDIYKTIVDKDASNVVKKDLGEELINILLYIISISKQQQFKLEQLWLDNIPQILYYNDVVNKYQIKPKLFDMNPVIGEYDDPKNQKQGCVQLPITTGGNTCIIGATGSGKSTLLSTMIYSMITSHNCEEVNIYVIDLGAEKLKKFSRAPQVGDVLTIGDDDKIKHLFYMLEDEKNKRQKYYSENNGSFLRDVKNGNSPFPNIVVFIYDIDAFKELYSDLTDDVFTQFTRNCSKFGIYFVVTAGTTSSLGFLLENNFPQKIMLNMVDDADYLLYFNNPPTPSKNPGRGIVKLDEAYEFQVPIVFEENSEITSLNYVFEQLNKFLKNPVPRVPIVPQNVNVNDMFKYCTDLTSVPLGINIETAQIGYFDFTKLVTLISTSNLKNSSKFISTMINLLSAYTNTNVIVLNGIKSFELNVNNNVKVYDSNFKKVVEVLKNNILKYNTTPENKQFIIFTIGYSKLQEHLEKQAEEGIITIDEMVEITKNNNFKFVVFDSAIQFENSRENNIFNLIDTETGIWIGSGFENQDLIEESENNSSDVKQSNDTAVLVKNGKSEYIKYIK